MLAGPRGPVRSAGQPGTGAADSGERTVGLGSAPPAVAGAPRAVAPLFEQPGVLTPKSQTVIELSLQ